MGGNNNGRAWVLLLFAALLLRASVCLGAPYLIATGVTDASVFRIDEAGQKSLLYTQAGSQPHEVDVAPNGDIFVADVVSDSIWRFSPSFGVLYHFPSNLDNPEGLAIDPNGNVFAAGTIGSADIFTPNQVARVTPAGARSLYASVGAQENLSAAMDLLGNLFVSDLTHNGSLWKVTPTQQVSEVVSNLGFATGITIAPDGVSVLVSASQQNKIWKVAPNGSLSVYANISEPWALAFDPAGNLFVGQTTQISKITSNGTQSVFATGLHDVRGIAYVPEPASTTSAILVATCVLYRRRRRHAEIDRLAV